MSDIQQTTLKLIAKVEIDGTIRCITGLHIGGAKEKVEIGGVDNPVIRDPLDDYPYIPGSSLKGAMRSKLELLNSLPLQQVKRSTPPIRMHQCDDNDCIHCMIFGRPASANGTMPTALYVYDAFPTDETRKKWDELEDYIEIKYENQLDRITSAANPRQIERVPAGSEFNFTMLYTIYDANNNRLEDALRYIFTGLKLIEDEYIGGYGSRGSGRVKFKDISIKVKSKEYYMTGDNNHIIAIDSYPDIATILTNLSDIVANIQRNININNHERA
ncbi:MAG: type III-A CRISPR-associated RAMP protein Csm3 [Candidatus Nitrosocaldus sp.]